MFRQFGTLLLSAIAVSAIDIHVSSTGGNASSPHMYGLMFEDINHSGDGGIYAELIQNRAFQGSVPFPSTIYPWEPVGGAVLALQNTSVPLSKALPTSINVSGKGKIGISNPGWWGIDVKKQKYTGSFWTMGAYKGKFSLSLHSNLTHQVFANTVLPSKSKSGKWTEHTFELEPREAAPNSNNTFTIQFDCSGESINFNLISLFPPTYKNRPNGNRPELMEALKALNPTFLRMPGGNNLEGDVSRYPWRWNETLGPLKDRPGRPGTWSYQNTDGLGLLEYFHWCEDLEVEPILGVWAGMFLGTEEGHILSAEALAPWVQDTLNELEFILGDVNTTYGALRASLGHPEPFYLRYVEVGNEDNLNNGGPSYSNYRFPMFYNAITAAYPNLTIISSTGDFTALGGSGSSASWTDYHIYSRPDNLVSRFGQFDKVSREHKTVVGEYAVIQENKKNVSAVEWDLPKYKNPVWSGAVAEAVWTMGAERNGDAVMGLAYAPGFQNLNSYQWAPDLISFTANPAQTVLSVSYRVIELFGSNTHKETVPAVSNSSFGPAYWVAGTNGPSKYVFKTAIYNSTANVPFNVKFDGIAAGTKGKLTVLSAPDGLSVNALNKEDGTGVVVETTEKRVQDLTAKDGGVFGFELANYEVAVLTT